MTAKSKEKKDKNKSFSTAIKRFLGMKAVPLKNAPPTSVPSLVDRKPEGPEPKAAPQDEATLPHTVEPARSSTTNTRIIASPVSNVDIGAIVPHTGGGYDTRCDDGGRYGDSGGGYHYYGGGGGHHYYDGGGGGGGCFSANSQVHMVDGSFKPIHTLVKGDRLIAGDGTATLECLVAIRRRAPEMMIQVSPGLCITPYHPIQFPRSGRWMFPNDLPDKVVTTSSSSSHIYNLVLSTKESTVVVGGITCIALGHGLTSDDIIAHEFWGSRERIIEALKEIDEIGFERGLVEIEGSVRDSEGRVCGFQGTPGTILGRVYASAAFPRNSLVVV